MGRFGRSWGWLFVFGLLTLVAGLVAVAWPGRTVLVLAIVFGAQLLAGGIFWFVTALSSRGQGTAGQIVAVLDLSGDGLACVGLGPGPLAHCLRRHHSVAFVEPACQPGPPGDGSAWVVTRLIQAVGTWACIGGRACCAG